MLSTVSIDIAEDSSAVHEESSAIGGFADESHRTFKELTKQRATARQLRWRVSGPLFASGLCLYFGGLPTFVAALISGSIGSPFVYMALVPPAYVLVALSLMPTDGQLIRVLCCLMLQTAVVTTMFLVTAASLTHAGVLAGTLPGYRHASYVPHAYSAAFWCTAAAVASYLIVLSRALRPRSDGWAAFASRATGQLVQKEQSTMREQASSALSHSLTIALLRCAGCRLPYLLEASLFFAMPARAAFELSWLCARWLYGAISLILFALAAVLVHAALTVGTRPGGDSMAMLACAASFLFSAMLPTSRNRQRFMARLHQLGSTTEEQEGAAIAGLIGNRPAAKALLMASSTFRTLTASEVTEAYLANNQNDGSMPALYSFARAAKLGECDGFISHSWSDDGKRKFRALSAWAHGFQRANGREPRVWLDKGCIDQQRIDESLVCLPIYLAGCHHLVVLVGPSYVRRLWCVMECFTFLRMGGALDRVNVILCSDGAEGTHETLSRQFETFECVHASCYHAEDKERLLAVILSGFGSLESFNQRVQHMFAMRSSSCSRHTRSKASSSARRSPSIAQRLSLRRSWTPPPERGDHTSPSDVEGS